MVRKATLRDVQAIYELISTYAREGLLLPANMGDVCERIREFSVYEDGKVVGCAALRIFTPELAEIRSVAVEPTLRGKGIGRRLVEYCVEEARALGLKKVFVLTKSTRFFEKCGFSFVEKRSLPHKVWRDCMVCPKFPECDEVAMIREIEEVEDGLPR